jgi:2-dehydropantoate 2-reductase
MQYKVGIIGRGGVGLFLAYEFYKKKIDYEIVSKTIMTDTVININNENEFVPNYSNGILKKYDIIFLATKYNKLFHDHHLLNNLINNSTIIIPLLNGMKHYELLAKKNILTATIGGINASRNDDKLSVINKNTLIDLSLEKKSLTKNLVSLIDLVDIKFKIHYSDKYVLWNKLARLSVVSLITAISNSNLGHIRGDKNLFKQMNLLIDEISILLNVLKISIKKNEIITQINNMPDNLETSLQRDINNNLDSELDTIIGEVILLAKVNNVKMKTFEIIYNRLKNK